MPPATKETLVKVMVVEDNAELRQFICEILSGTYRVVGVADGVMALEKIEEPKIRKQSQWQSQLQ